MEIGHRTLSKMWDDDRFQSAGFDYCGSYGEPGYGSTSTRGVLLANWWCSCGKVLERFDAGSGHWTRVGADDPTAPGERRATLHGYELHYPRLFAALEEQGYELEWSDEWVVDHNASKCYRTTGDSYQWQSSILWTDGDFLTPDDGIDAWIEEVVDNPHRCLPSNVWSASELAAAGFVQWEPGDPKRYESGWHAGQTDDPANVTREIRETAGYENAEILFLLDEASQFYIGFSAWTRATDHETDTYNEGDK